jgi:preprotein translocase subunit YajC
MSESLHLWWDANWAMSGITLSLSLVILAAVWIYWAVQDFKAKRRGHQKMLDELNRRAGR